MSARNLTLSIFFINCFQKHKLDDNGKIKKNELKKFIEEKTKSLYWLLISLDYVGNMILAVLNDDEEEENVSFSFIYLNNTQINRAFPFPTKTDIN